MRTEQLVVAVYNGLGMRFVHRCTVEPYEETDHVRIEPIVVHDHCPNCNCATFVMEPTGVAPASISCSGCRIELTGYYLAHASIQYRERPS